MKINPKNIEDILALTPLQAGMLFHYLQNPQNHAYFEQLSLEISGEIDRLYFEKAWNRVIEANEMLRTVFRWEKFEKPSQIILKQHQCKVLFYNLSDKENNQLKEALDAIKKKDRDQGFDLQDIAFRIILCKLGTAKYEIIISNHHILYDGWSTGIILREFFYFYHELIEEPGKQSQTLTVKPSFKEFLKWQQGQVVNEQEKSWKEYLAGFETPTSLPIKQKGGKEESVDVDNYGYTLLLPDKMKYELELFVKNYHISLAAIFYTSWGILLQKYSGIEDTIFGTTVSGRSAKIKGIEAMVGLFINTIPLRIETFPGESFNDILYRTDKTLQTREEFEITPLVDIKRYSGSESLFDTIVVIENYPLDNHLIPDNSPLTINSYSIVEMTHYDLTVSIRPFDMFEVKFSFWDIFAKEDIIVLASHYEKIIRHIIANPRTGVFQLEIISAEEKNRVLYEFNATEKEYPTGKTIEQLFAEQVEQTPDYIALHGCMIAWMDGDIELHGCMSAWMDGEVSRVCPPQGVRHVQLTYNELNEQSNNLAGHLVEKGVLSDPVVGIMIERSVEMIIGIWGILKAGGVYLPIDPGYPQERIDYMLKDSKARILITDNEKKKIDNCQLLIVNCQLSTAKAQAFFHHSPGIFIYLIYTSGSTGKPKGAMIEKKGFLNLLSWYMEELGMGKEDNHLLIAPVSFDLAQKNLFSPLLSGGRLTLALPGIPDYIELKKLISKERISMINCAPSVFYPLVELKLNEDDEFSGLHSLRAVVLGGEPIRMERLAAWIHSAAFNCEIFNTYGPTECTDIATCYRLKTKSMGEDDIIPIGKPIANVKVYVLDKYLQVLPVKIPGELCIGGIGVSKGYYQNKELTEEKFIDTPYLSEKRIYRTGDLTRWLPDGNIEFLGRIDQQVKIRGLRIELGEIESQLLKHKAIKEAVVIARKSENGENYLCAYLVAGEKGAVEISILRDYLRELLPGYMVPSYFVFLESMPLTPSGKIDRRGFPEPQIDVEKNYVGPRDRIEESLIKIWCEVLDKKGLRIGIDDHFFQLGGHSLKATALVSRIIKEFNVKIPLEKVFKKPTIRGLSVYIKEAVGEEYKAIEPVEKKDYYVLSSAQKRLYFLQQMDSGGRGTTYNISAAWVLEGVMDTGLFEQVFTRLIQRHESLRTYFVMIGEEPVQRIINKSFAELFQKRLFNKIKDFIQPFDLSSAPLLRVGLNKIEENKHILVVDMHHIISDGISTEILVREFSALYQKKGLLEINLQYKDYAEWQKGLKIGESLLSQGTYWRNEFAGDIPVLDLPLDYTRPTVQDFEGAERTFFISPEMTGSLNGLAFETGTTLYMVLLAIYNIFLARLSSQEDIVVGSPVAGRRHEELEKIIGMFVNTLALRNFPVSDKSFTYFLAEVKEKTLAAFENQEYQYEDLVEQVAVNRDTGHNPLFDTMIVLQNTGSSELNIPGLKIDTCVSENKTAKFDLTLVAVEGENKLNFIFEYSVKLFKEETIKRFTAYFINIINGVIADKNQKISEFEIITDAEKQQILYEFNNTEKEYPRNKSIVQLFAEQVEQIPDYIALHGCMIAWMDGCMDAWMHDCMDGEVARNVSLTYRQLNEQSDRLAYFLTAKGVLPDTIVGIMIDRSLDVIIGILGILKSGGAYLPIDPEYPQERIDYMLNDSQARLTINYEFLKDAPQAPFLQHSAFIVQHSNHLAYIIYTSGSTGKPKGVLIEQHAVLNLLFSMQNKYPFNTGDTYLFKTSYNFDVSVTELFGWFMGGGKLAILEKNGEKDPQVIMDWIERFQVTHINFVPSMFNAFITQLNKKNIKRLLSLKYIFLAGEVLLPEFVQTFRALDTKIKLENIYGPTENTVYSSWYSLADWNGTGNIPIGKLLPNVKLYILNTHNHLQPLGIPGELCISGTGLARGYLNNPELSAEKFIFSPNFLTSSPPKFPLYRTGDLARWLPDGPPAGGDSGGVIEFMGRIDHQVKIRGFRIELGEIENRLLKHPDVKEAVVLVQEESGDKSLCAYIVSIDEKVISGLKEYLSKELPDYMIPSYFLHLEKIPLTPNGKIDRKALPKPGLKAGDIYTAPRDETEKKLVELWAGILSRDEVHASQLKASIGIDDNFFQLGGHSLKATNLVSAIHKSLNVQVLLAEVFKRPTIRGLAGYIKGKVEEQYQAIEPVEKKENYELSSAQKRLFFLSQLDPEGMAYNIPIIIPLPGDFQIEKLSDVFKKLIKRHDSLRTSFHLLNNGPVQKIHEEVEFEIATDACGVHGQTRPPGGSLLKFLQQFDLSRAPLMRAGLLKNNDGSYILLVDIHHIVTDGTSQEVLKNDFMSLYKGEALPSLPLQYKDFAQWQNSNKENDRFKQQELYWLNEFPDEIPVLAIPTDYPRPLMQSFAGNNINFEIAARETGLLHDLVLQSGATLFMVLAAVLNILLAKLSGQEDIVIGTPVAGRRHADLEKIIGMFVNTLALRNYPVGKRTFREFLDLLKDRTLAAFENQEYPFDDLVEKVSITRDMGRNPLFDVLFVLQNISSVPGIPAEAVPGRRTFEDDNITDITRTTKFDLEITAWEAGQRLELDFGYGTKLFKKETIERFITYFKRIVSLVVKAKESSIRICDIEIITEEEKAQILFEFNDTAIEYPEDKTIHQLFAEQAAQTPDYIALHGCMSAWMDGCMDAWMHDCMDGEVASNVSLTYRQLNEQSDRLAGLLMEKGVLPDTIVAIMIERSIEMIIGILGILKSGGAYLPIDPGYPQERIDYMLKDSATSILLTNEKKKDNCQCSIVNCQLSMIERPRRGIQHSIFHAFDISRIQHSNHLCYIIYTSGSTGKPKGVMVEHKNLVHYLYAFTHEFNINACDTVLQQASYCFDVFAEEVYPVLLAGGRIAVPTKNQVLDINFLSIFILKNKITIVDCSPLLLNELDKKAPPLALQGIRIFISGGDVLKGEYVANLIKNRTVYNTYGPTETTICATYYKCPNVSLSDVPIGKPIAYYFVPILSENDHLVPIGVAGELCVAGPGVTRGYLNRPELTHEKFKIINYKLKIINGSGTLRADLNAFGDEENFQYSAFITQHSNFYSTGDLARWLPDGNIQFLGRIDQQVKIRGFRIELGEIESQLVKHEHIKDIVVVLKENGIGDKNLAAYYVADIELPPTELREYLLKNLPVYMIPTHFMRLEKIPVTSSGKVDRRALPMPQLSEMPQCTAPRNSIEMKLAKIWAEVLNIDSANHQIGIDDHFFHLGGHSLKATSLAARIYKEFNVKIPLKEFFQRSTIRQMAIYIKEAGKEEFAAVSPTEEKEYYPISSAQKRLYFLYQLEPGNITYNMPYMMILGENTVKEKLEEIFKELIARHESLRTSFETINMEPVQVIHKKIAFSILQSNVEEKDAEEIIAGLTVPFDLRQAPLLRVHYLTVASHPDHSCSPCRRMLFIDMHHIITDGTSQDTLAKEFALLAKGISLLPLALQYKDYSEWQRSTARQEALKEQEIYWLNEFAGELPVLQLPTDFPRPIEQTSSGNVVMFKLNALETAALKAMAKENDVTLYMALLAIFTILLAKLSGQDDIIVGTPIAARQHPDLQPVIGMFVNTLAMRNNPTGEKTFKLYLQEVKLRTLEAYENQDYPFEELVDHILVERDIGRNPVFDVLFNFLNENDYLNDQNLLPAEPGKHRKRTAKFDMNWTISEVDSELRVDIEYATKLFKPDSIDRFYSYFKNLVHKLPGEIELKIANIEILGEHEKEEILKLSEGDISPYDPKDTIPGLFADQVNKNPDCIALHGCMIAWMHGCMIAWMGK